MHSVKGQDDADAADHAGGNHSRMRKLRIEAQHANNEQYEENVRLHNAGEEFLARRELEGFAVRLAQNELRLAAVEPCNFAAVQLAQKVIRRTSNEVDELAVERFFLSKRSR